MIEVDVHDRDDAAIPRVRGVEASAEAHLDDREVHALIGEPAVCEGREQLELGRLPEAARDAVDDRESLVDEPGEGPGVHDASADPEALAVRLEMRLRRLASPQSGLAENRRDERQDAPLPVRPADEGAAEPILRMTHPPEDRPGAPETEADPEPRPALELRERVRVGEAHPGTGGAILTGRG